MRHRPVAFLLGVLLSACTATDSGEAGATSTGASQAPASAVVSESAGPSPSDASNEVVEHELPGLHASISLPGDWVVLTVADVGDGFDAAREDYPAAGVMLDAAEREMQDGEVRFFAFEPEPPGALPGNLSITHVQGPPPPTEEIAQQLAAAIEENVEVEGEVEVGTATVSAGEVAVIAYVAKSDGPDVRVTQFAYPRARDGLVLTLVAPNDLAHAYDDTWQEIVDSVTY